MTEQPPVDRLIAALTARGEPPPTPRDAQPIEALEQEIAPLCLPPTLRELWARIDVLGAALQTWPQLMDPHSARRSWRLSRDTGTFAPVLLPFCYESHNNLLVELAGGAGDGGAVFESDFASNEARLRCVHLDDWVDAVADLLNEGAFEPSVRASGRTRLSVDTERLFERLEERLASRLPDPVYGDEVLVPRAPDAWPAHWHAASEPIRRRQEPRGATTTVKQLLADSQQGEVRGTVRGALVMTRVLHDAPWRAFFTDCTGILDVACPQGIPGFHALNGNFFEFDLRLPKRRSPVPTVDWRALAAAASEEPGAEPRLHHLLPHVEPQAVAEEARPLEPGPPPLQP